MPDTVSLTAAGASKIREVLAAEPAAGPLAGLRIDVVSGGCSGYQYRLALDEQREGDAVFDHGDVRIIVDRDHLRFVAGASVHYAEDGGGAGFRVENPNVVYGCGCGSSFVLRDDAEPALRG